MTFLKDMFFVLFSNAAAPTRADTIFFELESLAQLSVSSNQFGTQKARVRLLGLRISTFDKRPQWVEGEPEGDERLRKAAGIGEITSLLENQPRALLHEAWLCWGLPGSSVFMAFSDEGR